MALLDSFDRPQSHGENSEGAGDLAPECASTIQVPAAMSLFKRPHTPDKSDPEDQDLCRKITKLENEREHHNVSQDDPAMPSSLKNKQFKKIKAIIVFGYLGDAYQGLQRNPGANTIEQSLIDAFGKVSAIDPCNLGSWEKVAWMCAARTDKGVSAVANNVSLAMRQVPEFVDQINSVLPQDIRVFGAKKVGKGFRCRTRVDVRRYKYVLPSFLFAPSKKPPSTDKWHFDEYTRNYVNRVLSKFLGARNYHKFTSRVPYNSPKAVRVMKSLTCSEPITIGPIEWVEITVIGQSFMLNQIRKMVALTINVVRDGQSEDVIDLFFTDSPTPGIHMAPAEGLYLDECLYDQYNKNRPSDAQILWIEERAAIDEFRDRHVVPNIYKKEVEDKIFSNWLDTIDKYPYSYESFLHDKNSPSNQSNASSISSAS